LMRRPDLMAAAFSSIILVKANVSMRTSTALRTQVEWARLSVPPQGSHPWPDGPETGPSLYLLSRSMMPIASATVVTV
jgi:hypothetical protein